MRIPPVTDGFRRLAQFREARAFHPAGRVGSGRLVLDHTGSALAGGLGLGQHPVIVRLSRGVGLPDRRPDLLGLAVRVQIHDSPVDLLFTTAATPAWAHWLVLPARRWTSRTYSTVLPYDTGDDRIQITLTATSDWTTDASLESLAEVSEHRPLTFDVHETHRGTVGRLVIDRVGEDDAIAFDPILNARSALRPVRPLAALREAAYRGSRAGRTTGRTTS